MMAEKNFPQELLESTLKLLAEQSPDIVMIFAMSLGPRLESLEILAFDNPMSEADYALCVSRDILNMFPTFSYPNLVSLSVAGADAGDNFLIALAQSASAASLRRFNATHNHFTDVTASCWSSLTALEDLTLVESFVLGRQSIQHISQLPLLQKLNLGTLRDLLFESDIMTCLAHAFVALRAFHIVDPLASHRHSLQALANALRQRKDPEQINYIDVSRPLFGPAAVEIHQLCPTLQRPVCRFGSISQLESLPEKALAHFTSISLSMDDEFDDVALRRLAKMLPALERLDISECIVSANLSGLTNLIRLSLGSCQIAPVLDLPLQLRSLALYCCDPTFTIEKHDEGFHEKALAPFVESLVRLTNLENFALDDCIELPASVQQHLYDSFPKATQIHALETAAADPLVLHHPSLKSWTRYRSSYHGPVRLKDCPSLLELEAPLFEEAPGDTPLFEAGYPCPPHLARLRYLHIGSSRDPISEISRVATSLRNLTFRRGAPAGLEQLATSLSRLQTLVIAGAELQHFCAAMNFRHITSLVLHFEDVTEIPAFSLPCLQKLRLRSARISSGPFIVDHFSFNRLEEFMAGYCEFQSLRVENLSDLLKISLLRSTAETLSVTNCHRLIVASIGDVKPLVSLELFGNLQLRKLELVRLPLDSSTNLRVSCPILEELKVDANTEYSRASIRLGKKLVAEAGDHFRRFQCLAWEEEPQLEEDDVDPVQTGEDGNEGDDGEYEERILGGAKYDVEDEEVEEDDYDDSYDSYYM